MQHKNVQDYYVKVLQSSAALQTNAFVRRLKCLLGRKVPSPIHDEVLMRRYGCGLIAPEALKSAQFLDLRCGAGRDV
jgi:hypothetical protein